jgi:HD-like signal output (HDOD) protein
MSVQVANEGQSIIAKALAKIGDIATLPEITLKIINIVEDPKSTARDLHEVIKHDPALSTKVLKVVNSAFYGLPGQIASVDRAIVLLGLSAVKNIAIAASISRMFKGEMLSDEFSAKDLWLHSLAVAVTSKMICNAQGRTAGGDEVFLGGLIHDIGILVERQAYPEKLTEVVTRATQGEANFLELETQIIGVDHQQFGMALTTKWKFPRHLRAVAGFHHVYEGLNAEHKSLVATVHAADVICCQDRHGFHLTADGEEFTEALLEDLQLTMEDIDEIREQLPEQIAMAETALGA